MSVSRLAVVCLALMAGAQEAAAQNTIVDLVQRNAGPPPGSRGGLTSGNAQEGSIKDDDPRDAAGRHYVVYTIDDAQPGDTIKIGVVAAGFRPVISFREPSTSWSDGVMVHDGMYVWSVTESGEGSVRISAHSPGETGKYKVVRLWYGNEWEMPAPNSRVNGLHLGVNLHNSNVQFEGDDFAWVGAGYAVRAAIGLTQNLVVHAELQSGLLDPGEGAPETVADEIWEFTDIELGARLYLLSGLSYFRPYVMGAYAKRDVELEADGGVLGNAIVVGGGLEFFFLQSLTLEVGGTYSMGEYDRFYAQGEEVDVEELGEEPFKANHRRLSFGLAWHPSFF